MNLNDALGETWDAIIIGTGIGGGMAGRRLAERGLRVLFVEQGPAGYRTEEAALNSDMFDPVARQIRGFWPTPMQARINGRDSQFFGPIGGGVGGSSVFYAATLERPEPHDLDDSADKPHPIQGWPVTHAQMRPYFDQAEDLFSVGGDPDPLAAFASTALRDPAPMSQSDQAMKQRLSARGLHPYQLHAALRRIKGCKSCLGFKCPKTCKMDGRSAGVEPALETGRAALLDRCAVRRLKAKNGRITGVVAERDGDVVTLSAGIVILAAGAFGSPRLLLASQPGGLANRNGMVGCNLMFHLNEMIAVWPGKSVAADGPSKSLGFRDLYHVDGTRLGMVQAMGIEVSYGEIVHYLKQLIEKSSLHRFRLLKELTRIPALIAAKLFGNAQVFVGLMEDLPYAENRVLLDPHDPDAIRFDYTISKELLTRRRKFRRLIRQAFTGHRRMFLGFQPELNFGHPCGTLRFGADPETSVLDPDCRAHELENLYVADASIFPTSMGVNPSLTIAANALRVADQIADQFERKTDAAE
ncbi:6'''-hydroxyparomomycin C oxidase [Thalassovita gelatinovora]|uniref:6'''-hydroxyparomomycin C oxidase n=1 Tax=Thalassovita gelatinovora TaxID=53501 RepID=A0A0N7LUY3_THAGE|nr:GMC family oxidoreductase [Thalassovita gelatinovora]QIZ81170.1 GMC family oxidoreductase [Thalassovita gelatinovora]CUH64778.1 6'''-hydroxyparomomycin C oxidase [Thalassovita gelatinovora]SEP92187.1 Choline dehydrogenase [Thalassovita gelatinovora]